MRAGWRVLQGCGRRPRQPLKWRAACLRLVSTLLRCPRNTSAKSQRQGQRPLRRKLLPLPETSPPVLCPSPGIERPARETEMRVYPYRAPAFGKQPAAPRASLSGELSYGSELVFDLFIHLGPGQPRRYADGILDGLGIGPSVADHANPPDPEHPRSSNFRVVHPSPAPLERLSA